MSYTKDDIDSELNSLIMDRLNVIANPCTIINGEKERSVFESVETLLKFKKILSNTERG